MKRLYLMAVAVGLCVSAVAVADGDTGTEPVTPSKEDTPSKVSPKDTPQKEVKIPASKAVAKALSGMETFNGTPNYKAKYYIYLQSASWCGPCNQEMPEIVKAYPKMQKQKVEIILVGCDSTVKAAEGFLTKYKAKFPGVMSSAPEARNLPGIQKASGIPHATIVDEKGRVLADGHGSIIREWESHIKKKPAKKSRN